MGDYSNGVAEAAQFGFGGRLVARAPSVPALRVFFVAAGAYGAVGGVPCRGLLVLAWFWALGADLGSDVLNG